MSITPWLDRIDVRNLIFVDEAGLNLSIAARLVSHLL
ncbi:hypothetical protein NIES4073_18330 [Kalymmatonema gypsitolerans NIES-4073]|nr:hypothetical protein NIES4073_18330 [Scytonema sp. NIES-4073]